MIRALFCALLGISIIGVSSGTAGSKCERPSLRKEWRSLGYDGQKAYIDAVKCLSHLPHETLVPTGATPGLPPIRTNSSLYDDVVYVHMDATKSVHFTGRFLPWHRLYLHTMEGLLRNKCGYTGHMTYWDWTIDSHDTEHSPLFSADPTVGFGTFPDQSTNFTLSNGAFHDIILAYPVPHRIQRNYSLTPWETPLFSWPFPFPQKEANTTTTPAEYVKITTSFNGNLTAFQYYMDGHSLQGMHGAIHGSLGGDIKDLAHSPNDPLFFLHHGQLDRIWAKWQAHDQCNRNAIAGGVIQDPEHYDAHPLGTGTRVTEDTILYMAGVGPDAKVHDVLSTTGGYLCYQYAT
jgi:tyrosinase